MRKVLITGANGFVGRHVANMLCGGGWSVRGAVRRSRALERLDSRVEGIVVGEINGETDWTKALEDVDVVVHLAARVHVLHDTAADPLAAFRTVNVDGTRRLLEAAAEAGVRRFVFMSSVKAVGEGRADGMAYTESDPYEFEDAYGQSKAEAEQLVLDISRETGVDCVILRPPMVYGPGVKANLLRLMRAVDKGLPFPLGSVRNRRSMVYVNNLAHAVNVCVEHPAAAGQIYFVADDEHLSTPELIREIAQQLGKRPRLIPVPVPLLIGLGRLAGRSGEIDRLTGSLTVSAEKIKDELGWSPPWSVQEGLRDTAAAYRASNS